MDDLVPAPALPRAEQLCDRRDLYVPCGERRVTLWASFINNTYALGVARSVSGTVLGPWVQDEKALFESDGGHAMLFRAFDGRLMLAIHTPNKTPNERPLFLEVEERDGRSWVKEQE